MSLLESSGALSKASKDLVARWNNARAVWSDAQSEEFEKNYILLIEQDVRSAISAMDRMNQVLTRVKNECE